MLLHVQTYLASALPHVFRHGRTSVAISLRSQRWGAGGNAHGGRLALMHAVGRASMRSMRIAAGASSAQHACSRHVLGVCGTATAALRLGSSPARHKSVKQS